MSLQTSTTHQKRQKRRSPSGLDLFVCLLLLAPAHLLLLLPLLRSPKQFLHLLLALLLLIRLNGPVEGQQDLFLPRFVLAVPEALFQEGHEALLLCFVLELLDDVAEELGVLLWRELFVVVVIVVAVGSRPGGGSGADLLGGPNLLRGVVGEGTGDGLVVVENVK